MGGGISFTGAVGKEEKRGNSHECFCGELSVPAQAPPQCQPCVEAGEWGNVPSAAEVGKVAVLVGAKPRWALL